MCRLAGEAAKIFACGARHFLDLHGHTLRVARWYGAKKMIKYASTGLGRLLLSPAPARARSSDVCSQRRLEKACGAFTRVEFHLLGTVSEKVGGQSYCDYVREHIYEPSDMSSSGSEPEDETVSDRSVGYTRLGDNVLHPNTDTLPYRSTSAGGGYSSVEDLLKFANALLNHKLLNAQFTDLLTTGKVDEPGASYVCGFRDQSIGGIRCLSWAGLRGCGLVEPRSARRQPNLQLRYLSPA